MSETAAAVSARHRRDVAALLTDRAAVAGQLGLLWIRGKDGLSFLDALISQSVAAAESGTVRPSLLLTPQGKMRALLWVLRGRDDEVGLVTQSTTADTVASDLARFKFRVDAAIDHESRPMATLVGPTSAAALAAADLARPRSGWLETSSGLVAAVPFATSDLPRFLLVGDAVAAIGAVASPADASAYTAVRIAVGEPLGNVDFDDKTIAHELGPVDAAVDFDKGCYLGQELIARIDSRGRVNRTLRTIEAAELKDLQGAILTAEDKNVGSITSWAPHPLDGGTIALATVRHEIENGTELIATGQGATALPVMVKAVPALSK